MVTIDELKYALPKSLRAKVSSTSGTWFSGINPDNSHTCIKEGDGYPPPP